MITRQAFADWIQNTIPKAAEALGVDLQKWVAGSIRGIEDKWFVTFQIDGGNQTLANTILDYLDIPSIGYDDFQNEKAKQVAQYQTYVDAAQQVVNSETDELTDLNHQLAQATDQTTKDLLQVQITNQIATLKNETQNLATWKLTMSNFVNGLPSAQAPTSSTSSASTSSESTTTNENVIAGAKPTPQEA